MKNFYFLILLIFCNGFSQNKILLTKDGIAPVVTEIDSKTAEQLFLKTKEWIQLNYKNPSEVLKAEIVNDMIRIEGYSTSFFYLQSLGKQFYDLKYTIEFYFKDGKYKFSFVGNKVTSKGQNVPFFTLPTSFFKNDGVTVRSLYTEGYDSYIKSVEDLYLSHYNYITDKTVHAKNDW
jgi:hypothetical protein